MIGILVAIGLSYLLLYFSYRQNITVLGFLPIRKITKLFFIGFIISCVLCIVTQLFEAWLTSSVWVINTEFSSFQLLNGLWWDLKSVTTEELIFRGALLYILIKKLGSTKAIIISAITFGIYHWFSYGIIGQVIPMVLIFIGTGFIGYVWAQSFVYSGSILLPIGLHLGWNFTHNSIFSKGPLGNSLLISHGGNELNDWLSLINFMTPMLLVPLITLIIIKKLYTNKKQQDFE